uniref:amidohydrolase n=1 Tax=Candidatus Fimenecus sp. TaxID=3022888 RepID=UPI003FF0F067
CYNAMQEPTVEEIKDMILTAQRDINAAGITGVETDNFLSLPGRNSERIMKAYRELEEEGLLTLRIREQASFTAYDHMKEFIDKGYRTGDGGEYYTIGPVKLYEDGSLGARTALMNSPYLGTDTYGTAVHDQADTDRLVDYAYKNDMQILIHAIGDKASDMVCDAYEKAIEKYGDKGSRLAINHLQVISPDLIGRMKAHGIVAYIQPLFVASDRDIIGKLMGEEVAARSYMWRTMQDSGIVCGGGSDSPVESFDVLKNIQVAVTRDRLEDKTDGWHPSEKLTISEAVRMFTANNAYLAFEEHRRGSIEIGKDADMTVLERDIFQADPHEIGEIKISKTIVAGKEVYNG